MMSASILQSSQRHQQCDTMLQPYWQENIGMVARAFRAWQQFVPRACRRRRQAPLHIARWRALVVGARRLALRRRLWHTLGVYLDFAKRRGKEQHASHWLSGW